MKGFIKKKVYGEGKGIITANVGIENGKIVYIGNDNVITEEIKIDNDAVILPGFIDEHIHGAGGFDAMDGTTDALKNIASKIASEGTTGFLATTMTQSYENISKAMKAVKDYRENNSKEGAKVLGIHLEGPFISLKHIGAQPEKYVAKPLIDTFKDYNEKSGNAIKIVSLAPEVDGALELIEYLDKNGIVASAGHTDSGYNDIEKAIKYGLKNITHTYNAQKGLHHREVGTVGSAMLFDSLNCEAICDLIHLSIPAIKLLIKNKPHDKFTLITDSMRAKHLKDGISELGGQEVIVKNGEARLKDGTLAGSILKMNDAVKNLVLSCGVPFLDAVDFATINPAKNLSLDKEIGSIKLGKNADFAIMDNNFNILLTIRNGEVIYKK
ncbi:MAG: N-acetylglucosamine-6-phosphate deacetylase [Firmicutes bacterium]|nr:N-acetylglucosamine-6-phosphate deacetylase [Candidatus Caballimonas caccae]